MTNAEMVQKGLITASDLASAGKLNPKQADQFIDFVIDETSLSGMARIARFTNETLEIDKIGVGKRAALPKAQAVAPTVRRGITTSKIILAPKEIIVPFEVGDNFSEINIEGQSVEERIIRMMSTQFANDIEELYLSGDVLGEAVRESEILDGGSTTQEVKDEFLALFNGWLRLSDSGNVVDLAGATVDPKTYSKKLNALPNKFKKNRNRLRFMAPFELEQAYRENTAQRQTVAGDNALSSNMNLNPFGIELNPVSLMSGTPTIVEHLSLTGTDVIALRYKPVTNMVVNTEDLASTPETAFIEGTDYDEDLVNGTIANTGTGAISGGQTVKVTYRALPQVLLTPMSNLVIGIGRDIRIERDRNIFAGLNQFVITAKVACEIEELTAVVKGINISDV